MRLFGLPAEPRLGNASERSLLTADGIANIIARPGPSLAVRDLLP